jgi:hypothetical protein
MAAGEGEHLEALGELMGVRPDKLDTFCRMARSNYHPLVEAAVEDPALLVAGLHQEILTQPGLLTTLR